MKLQSDHHTNESETAAAVSTSAAVIDRSRAENMVIIDYEYASFNPRAFDIGNHFNGKKIRNYYYHT